MSFSRDLDFLFLLGPPIVRGVARLKRIQDEDVYLAWAILETLSGWAGGDGFPRHLHGI